jgi:hypothetical protein
MSATTYTSIDELKALVTLAEMVTIEPRGIAFEKLRLSTEAVTTILPLCLWAEIAATMSIKCIIRPPIRLFKVLVSLGRTNSVELTNESWGLRFFIGLEGIMERFLIDFSNMGQRDFNRIDPLKF